MPHIKLPEGLPGIRGAMAFRPESAKPLNELAEILLHQPNSLPAGDRELIATYVSYLNDCYFCQTAHGAIAAAHLNDNEELVKRVKADFQHADISAKLKTLLVIASKVQKGGKYVTAEDVEEARAKGQRMSRFTIRCSLRRHSACTTATWMDLQPGNRERKSCTVSGARRQHERAMSRSARNTSRRTQAESMAPEGGLRGLHQHSRVGHRT